MCGVVWLTYLIWSQGTAGSNPATQTKFALIAQLVEQLICNHQVRRSNRRGGTITRYRGWVPIAAIHGVCSREVGMIAG